MLSTLSRKQKSRMQEYLEVVNRLPLDKQGKIEFVKAHVETLKKEEKETKRNQETFNCVLTQLLSQDQAEYKEEDEHKSDCVCCSLDPLVLRRS